MRVLRSILCLACLSACTPQLDPGDNSVRDDAEATRSASHGGVEFGVAGQLGSRQFKLARATLEVSGSASVILRAPRDVVAATLSAPLPAGAYATYLRPGFELHEVFADGSEHKVEASLIGKNPRVTRVLGGRTEPQALAFDVAGSTVVVGGAPDLRSAALTHQP